MPFPYERYETLAEPLTVYYPTGEESLARWIFQTVNRGSALLSQLLGIPVPELELLLVTPTDWEFVPHSEPEELANPQPFWTDSTSPPTLVVPLELDAVFGEPTEEKLAFLLFHELAVAFLESDPRPYPNEYPLWADEWQIKFAALWLSLQINHVPGIVNTDLLERYAEIFEPEEDGKTPITVRGFDWYEDTTIEDYLCYELLLEQLAADMLATYNDANVLPRFLIQYRQPFDLLLSDTVTEMLGTAIGPGGTNWLEKLVYF
jgi:hypothetical protein